MDVYDIVDNILEWICCQKHGCRDAKQFLVSLGNKSLQLLVEALCVEG